MKAHILQSDEPIQSGIDHVAACGKTVSKAEFACFVDAGHFQEIQLPKFYFCNYCRETQITKRYIYGLLPGQELKTEGVE